MSEFNAQLVEELRARKLYLYLPPHATVRGEAKELPQELIAELTEKLGRSGNEVRAALTSIQSQALKKLEAQLVPVKMTVYFQGTRQQLEYSLNLSCTGFDLREELTLLVSESDEQLTCKIIHGGKILALDQKLRCVGVERGSKCLVMFTEENSAQTNGKPLSFKQKLQWIKDGAAEVAFVGKQESGGGINTKSFFELSDGHGNVVDLSEDERRWLILAMVLQAEGLAALKDDKHADALCAFLESEEYYMRLRNADVFRRLDNFVPLLLDICWTYYELRDEAHTEEAFRRLKVVRETLDRRDVEGRNDQVGQVSRRAHRARLLPLEAIAASMSGNRSDALDLCFQAKDLLNRLQISDEDLTAVMEISNCSQAEAISEMRLHEMDAERAVVSIVQKREELKQVSVSDERKRAVRSIQKRLPMTQRGDYLDVDLMKQLTALGFESSKVVSALVETNNDEAEATMLLSAAQTEALPEIAPFQMDSGLNSIPTPTPTEIGAGSSTEIRAGSSTVGGSSPGTSNANVSHQKNPLASLLGAIALAYSDHVDDEEDAEDEELLSEIRGVLKNLEHSHSLCSSMVEEAAVVNQLILQFQY
ncbi:hypothetical protein NDN08_001975 [Rhodosorus marinus]|uniref:UBA domain-containing protein n=1 Tax=Rhodosorus marinus TaxID=101924 RepID=A0AAV8UWJ1_9RHOD|nr:hypothetical protein NDN08_001975 [Rhodosorus marinus]